MNNELPDKIYVRAVTDKTLSAVRPDSPIAQAEWQGKLKRTEYVRVDYATPQIDVEALKRNYAGLDDYNHAGKSHVNGWNACIDHLAAHYDFVPKKED